MRLFHLDKVTRDELWRRIFIVTGLVMLSTILVLQLLQGASINDNTQAIRNTQQKGSPMLKAVLEQGKTIKSCTDPKGKCYQDGQKRTADAVGDINKIAVYAVICGKQIPTGAPQQMAVKVMKGCIRDLMKDD